MVNDITIIIHTFNEEDSIRDCIKSARLLTNKIIVVDAESTDNTREIAAQMNAIVHKTQYNFIVETARMFGIQKAQTDWIFFVDADERMTEELAEEIKARITSPIYSYYKVPRKNFFAGEKWLKYGGWYPDYVTRLIRKEAIIDWPPRIHSTPQIMGESGFLKNPLIHFFHPSLEEMLSKTLVFENAESQLLFKAQKKVNTLTLFRKFFGELSRRLIWNVGFLDGIFGIIEAIYQAYSKTITYLFLYEKYKKSSSL